MSLSLIRSSLCSCNSPLETDEDHALKHARVSGMGHTVLLLLPRCRSSAQNGGSRVMQISNKGKATIGPMQLEAHIQSL